MTDDRLSPTEEEAVLHRVLDALEHAAGETRRLPCSINEPCYPMALAISKAHLAAYERLGVVLADQIRLQRTRPGRVA